MNFHRTTVTRLLICCTLITACHAEPVAVSVHGVNYTEDEIYYKVIDPVDKTNSAGGESVLGFGAGGTMCCYSIPKKWQPGKKVGLEVEVWLTSLPHKPGNAKIEKQTLIVDLPKPADGKPSDLWVVRNPDGGFELIASNVSPPHANWPGKVKGWPVASKSFREKLIRRDLAKFEEDLRLYQDDQATLLKNPNLFAKEQWEFDMEHRKTEVSKFLGPSDPNYVEYLTKRTGEMVAYTEQRISSLKKELR